MMGRQLTLELPDELYEPLAQSAEAVGQTFDEVRSVRIANITPDEWETVPSGTINMPEGWKLDSTECVFALSNQKRPA